MDHFPRDSVEKLKNYLKPPPSHTRSLTLLRSDTTTVSSLTAIAVDANLDMSFERTHETSENDVLWAVKMVSTYLKTFTYMSIINLFGCNTLMHPTTTPKHASSLFTQTVHTTFLHIYMCVCIYIRIYIYVCAYMRACLQHVKIIKYVGIQYTI